MSVPDRRELLIREGGTLSLRRQCALPGLARSGIYRTSRAANDNDPALMRRIDELFLTWPFLGSRRMTAMLRAETLTKTADAASEKLWSGYALPTFPACSAKWPTFTPPSGRFLRRR